MTLSPAAVARDADAADHRVDPIAVRDRVGEALEHDDPDPLAEQRSIGVLVERAELLSARERSEPAEQVHRRDRHPHLRSAREREIAFAAEQVADRVPHGDERGRTGGIDRIRGPHQVEPVRDPADDDVRDEPGNRFRSERRELLAELTAQAFELLAGVLGMQAADELDRLPDHKPPLHRDRVSAVQVRALAEDDCRPLPDIVG